LLSSLRSQKQQITDVAKLRRLLKRMIMDKQVELLIRENQIVIRILQGGSFQAGKAELKKQFMPVAKKLRKALGSIEGAITVTGHTDDRPIKSKRFRSNWELAGARAYSVMHELLRNKELIAGRFVLNGAGATEPIDDNETRHGRERNRRVEIEIDQKNTSYREKLEALGAEKKEAKDSKSKDGDKKGDKASESKKKKKKKKRKRRSKKRRKKKKNRN
jgi:chemotaxis protein MotB